MPEKRNIKPQIDQDGRFHKRLPLFRSDGLFAMLYTGKNKKLSVTVFDLNPFGACIKLKDTPDLKQTSDGDMKIEINIDNITVTFVAKLKWVKSLDDGVLWGMEFLEQITPVPSSNPLKDAKFPIIVPDFFSLSGFLYKPYLFFERGTFKVLGLSKRVWQIQIFESDSIIYKSQKIEIWLLGVGENGTKLEVEVLAVTKGPSSTLIVQCLLHHVPSKLMRYIARQLIFVCGNSPVELRNIGLNVPKISNGFRFRFVKTQKEYEGVLQLRYRAYLEAGKISDDRTINDMIAPLDYKSRILMCLHGEKIVASVAIAFPTEESEVLDTEKVFPNGYPKKMPPKKDVVEIARLCTDSNYRRTDLLERIFEYTYKVTLCGDRKFILTSTDNKLWKIYKKLGFKKTGMSYAHPNLSGMEHHIIVGHRNQPDQGQQISPMAWNYVWRDMNLYMDSRGLIKRTLLKRIRIALYKLFGRIFRLKKTEFY